MKRVHAHVVSRRWLSEAAWCALLAVCLLAAVAHRARGEAPAPPAAKAAGACKRGDFRVVIDVGHTLAIPGADSARGVPEYTFNLALADMIKQALLDTGFDKTVRLITATAPWRGLVERAERANAMHADLFIAIHHDSVPNRLIESWEYEGQKHQFSDRFSGYSIFVSNDNGDPRGSLAFGHLLGMALQARGLHYTPHYTLPLMGSRQRRLLDAEAGVYSFDLLVVLRRTRMPAVLLEAGSIVNRNDELELATPERRALVAGAVVSAVEDFCAALAQPSAAHSAKAPPSPKAAPHSAKPAAPAR